MKKQKRAFPVKIILAVAALLAAFFAVNYSIALIKGADYFRIKDVIISSQDRVNLSYLKGVNLFKVDLKGLSASILRDYPAFKAIRIIRVLPDRLFVEFVRRIPVAQIKLYRYFYTDTDSVLFVPHPDPGQQQELPVILGLETKIFGAKPGIKYNVRELQLALSIIKEVNSSKALEDYKIDTIDVSSPGFASIMLSFPLRGPGYPQPGGREGKSVLEIKLSQGNLEDKFNILSNFLSQSNNDRYNISYIDLRFKEPVIKLNKR